MHDHHGGGLGINLLPTWATMFWVPLLAAVCALHLIHLARARGYARRFHVVHLLVGLGMVYMFAPWTELPLPAEVPIGLFGMLTVLVGAFVGLELQMGRRVNLLWFLAVIECAAMGYMFAVHHGSAQIPALSRMLVAFYVVLVAAWTHGWLAEPAPGQRRSPVPYDLGSGSVPARQLFCTGRWDLAAAEAAMSLAMAYMFLGMDPGAGEFFAEAFTTGAVTEQSLWAVSLIAIAVLALVPGRRSRPTQTPQGYTLVRTRSGGGQ